MSSTELVDRRAIRFGGGRPWGMGHVESLYVPPRDTCDPRYNACVAHRPACDCREAHFAEDRAEWLWAHRQMQQAADDILAGHPTYTYDGSTPCMCTGCQIARRSYIHPRKTR